MNDKCEKEVLLNNNQHVIGKKSHYVQW